METLILERDARGVATIVMNRPERKNAIDQRMFEELLRVFREVEERPADRVLVLTGAGDSFSAGADLSGDGAPDRPQLARMQFYGSVGLALHRLSVPSIANIRGVALGHGLAEALDAEGAAQSVNTASEDTREAFRAFFEKREPVFRGR